jgi:hypothetical protein
MTTLCGCGEPAVLVCKDLGDLCESCRANTRVCLKCGICHFAKDAFYSNAKGSYCSIACYASSVKELPVCDTCGGTEHVITPFLDRYSICACNATIVLHQPLIVGYKKMDHPMHPPDQQCEKCEPFKYELKVPLLRVPQCRACGTKAPTEWSDRATTSNPLKLKLAEFACLNGWMRAFFPWSDAGDGFKMLPEGEYVFCPKCALRLLEYASEMGTPRQGHTNKRRA